MPYRVHRSDQPARECATLEEAKRRLAQARIHYVNTYNYSETVVKPDLHYRFSLPGKPPAEAFIEEY